MGAPGSLEILRNQGYRTFDHAIDNRYDEITHNTKRWTAIKRLLTELKQQNLHEWYMKCLEDVRHNQHFFQDSARAPLDKLIKDLKNSI